MVRRKGSWTKSLGWAGDCAAKAMISWTKRWDEGEGTVLAAEPLIQNNIYHKICSKPAKTYDTAKCDPG